MKNYFFMLGHSQPFEQSLQHAQVHLQFGQSLQQSFEQQVPDLQVAALSVREADCPAKLAAIMAAATNKPPNNLTNIENSLSLVDRGHRPRLQKLKSKRESIRRFAFDSNDPGTVKNAMRHRRRYAVVNCGNPIDLAGIDGEKWLHVGQRRD